MHCESVAVIASAAKIRAVIGRLAIQIQRLLDRYLTPELMKIGSSWLQLAFNLSSDVPSSAHVATLARESCADTASLRCCFPAEPYTRQYQYGAQSNDCNNYFNAINEQQAICECPEFALTLGFLALRFFVAGGCRRSACQAAWPRLSTTTLVALASLSPSLANVDLGAVALPTCLAESLPTKALHLKLELSSDRSLKLRARITSESVWWIRCNLRLGDLDLGPLGRGSNYFGLDVATYAAATDPCYSSRLSLQVLLFDAFLVSSLPARIPRPSSYSSLATQHPH